jgi:glucose-1-phosphate cytidylyltransferase
LKNALEHTFSRFDPNFGSLSCGLNTQRNEVVSGWKIWIFEVKVIILAGGLGTRISEETETKPKPMVLLDDKPIIWHLMSIFAFQGVSDFIIATGHMGHIIHEWVENLKTDWNIKAIDTGQNTMTGGRIRQCMQQIVDDRVFVTYGDGLANINISELLDFHSHQGRLATVTAVRPPARFGVLESSNGLVTNFGEKRQTDSGWINGGFFVLERGVQDYIHSDDEAFETGAIPRLVERQQLSAFHHEDFWQPMDTLREKIELSRLLQNGDPPWLRKII